MRPNNEDAAFAGPRLLALADGVGGHAAGEIASSLVVEHLKPLNDRLHSDDLLRDLHDAITKANAALAEQAARHPEIAGMATTLTAIYFAGNRLGLAHIGDSRAYLLRDGRLTQLTKDDTLVQSLVDEGRLTPEQARRHPQRSMVLKVLTGHPVEPFFEIREVVVGDRYLICSDGLSDY
ncbi:MAG: PP2C family protein-serine/threonine phosphatase, partial [Actinomycetota bacterium]